MGAQRAGDRQRWALASLRFIPRVGPFPSANPPAPRGPTSHRTIKGGAFSGNTMTLTPANGIHHGIDVFSLIVSAQRGWTVAYSVPCAGNQARLVIRVLDLGGRVLDRVLHNSGSARNIRQIENVTGPLRLDVRSRCPNWSITASPVYG